MGSDEIKKELTEFESSIKKLSQSIGQAGALWSDKKYSELSSAVSEIAGQSKDVIVAGENSCSQIEKFMKIASEEY